jgi:F0F1-type ATP synthase assembly protein I
LFLTAAQQAPPLTLLTAAVVAGVVIGVFGHLGHSRPLILFGIVVVGAVCAYVVVSSYLGAFVS